MAHQNSLMERLSNWYQTLAPEKRKQLTILATIGGFLLVATIMVTATSDNTAMNLLKPPRKVEYTLFNGKKPRDVTIDALSGRINKLTEDINEMRSTFQRQEQKIDTVANDMKQQAADINKQTAQLNAETQSLFDKAQFNAPKKGLGSNGGKPPLLAGQDQKVPDLMTAQPGQPAAPVNQPAPSAPKIRVVTAAGEGSTATAGGSGKKKIAEFVNVKRGSGTSAAPDMFLPAGSIVSGTLLTGLDAPTSNQTRDDPFPVLVRIKHQAILPNFYKMDITECFMIASGYGDLSSERAYMRSERLSCVRKDGGVIETPIDAYSVGEDGKTGVRGRLVSKNGQLIGNALLSGFVSGLSGAFAPQQIQSLQTNVLPGQAQPYQYPSPQMVGGQALAGGIKGAAAQIAQYYLEMAKNIFPVIEVDAGRKVEFVLIRGMEIKVRQKSQSPGGSGIVQARRTTSDAGNAISAFLSGSRQRSNPGSKGFGGGLVEPNKSMQEEEVYDE